MRRLLNEDDITSRIDKKLHEVYSCPKTEYAEGYVAACEAVKRMLTSLSPAEQEVLACGSGKLDVPDGWHWIPCSERLPEEYGEYLISYATSESKRRFIAICECEVTSEYDYEHERFECEWQLDDYIKNCHDVTVIAWMPLPEPYREDKE